MMTATGKILCAANWESDVGYAWWLMERFWAEIARRHPGRVIVSFPKVKTVSPALAGLQVVENAFDLTQPEAVVQFVREQGIEHLYLTDRPYYCRAYGALRRAGVRTIIMHDHMPGDRAKATGLKRAMKYIAARSSYAADAYIACSEQGMKRFDETCVIPSKRTFLARNGIDLSVDIRPVDIRAELGLPSDAVLIVSSGRAVQYKGIQHIIRAAADVNNAYFLHCGDGPDCELFREQIRAANLGSKYFMLGRRSDVPGILASADIAVHASAGEGLSLAILEFMRAGLPIVLPDSPTVTQSVTSGVSALLYKPGDERELAEKLSELVARPELRRSIGAAALRQVRDYDLARTIDSVHDVFARLRV